ncbi:MAG: phenylalanine--tRNA ligase subunit beta [Candidatus Geothermincolia bacterium]
MRVSLEWLREYVDIEMTPAELADALTLSGTAVDRVHTLGGGVTGVVVAQVVDVKPHPGADNLMLAVVDDGTSTREVVCGAPNLRPGMKSPLANVGATLPAVMDKPLKKAQIRGVESDGMLLAADELGIGDDHAGIIELSPDAAPGTDVHEVLPLEDVVFELEITPNRPDCMSVIGVAREVAALTGAKLRMPPAQMAEEGPDVRELATIRIEDPEGCPRYTARVVEGVRIGPSPAWMQRRLTSAGLRPISNIVDVTNYVLLETGQPLHAFDLDALAERTIVVRKAGRGEPMRTLDGVDRQLDERCVVIADAKIPVALAGVMGGEDSEVTERSTNILIESAHFDPTSILLTSKRLGLRSEASGRFERGVDPDGTSFAAARAARLMVELAGGKAAGGEIDVYPTVIEPHRVQFRPGQANRLLGIELTPEHMTQILESLGARVESGDILTVTAPSFRRDLEREVDLVEEIARVYGYDKIPSTLPSGGGAAAGLNRVQGLERDLRAGLMGQGLSQVITYSFMRPSDLDLLKLSGDDDRRRTVSLLNPLAETGEVLRTLLVPGMLRVASGNLNRGNRDLALFETGRAYLARSEDELPDEVETLAILMCGSSCPPSWADPERATDFFDLKGIIEDVVAGLGATGLDFAPAPEPFLSPGRAAAVMLNGRKAGYLGQLHPSVAAAFDLECDVYLAEIELARLLGAVEPRVFGPVGRFPNVKVDIAVIVDEGMLARKVESVIRAQGGSHLKSVRLFDVYQGLQVGAGKKSLAYALEYGSPEGTLTDEQAHGEMDRLIEALRSELGASIRGREREGDVS